MANPQHADIFRLETELTRLRASNAELLDENQTLKNTERIVLEANNKHQHKITVLQDINAELLAACQAMLEPFGYQRTTYSIPKALFQCQVCKGDWSNPVKHTTNCPVPIAEAAIQHAQEAPP